jgi:NADPH2:quinone reductase
VALPDEVSDELGASLGIAGITAHHAVFSDGPVKGKGRLGARGAPNRRGALSDNADLDG